MSELGHPLYPPSADFYVCGWCLGSGLDKEQPKGPVKAGDWILCRYCKGNGLPVPGGPFK